MGLPWIRLETVFPFNPKALALVEDKAWQTLNVYTFGLCYSGAHGTDGFIPRLALPILQGRKIDAQKLVEVGLWVECAGGWDINGWTDFQPTAEEFQKRKERAKKAAASRWSKEQASGSE